MESLDDAGIVELYLLRDEEAIGQTSAKYGSRLRTLSLGIVLDRETAEECENDTYLEAWNNIPPHEPRSYLYAFLARITRHISLNCCRDRSRLKRSAYIVELSTEMEECIPAPNDLDCRIDDLALSEAINGFLRSLKKGKRNIFIRRYWYGSTYEELEQHCGLSKKKLMDRVYQLRKRLKAYLEQEGVSI